MFSHNDRFVCPNCFASYTTDYNFCPACGYSTADPDRVPVALPVGTILYGKYMVGKVLGKGGFGITYLGYNLFTCEKVAIKEYLPDTLSYRSTGNTGVSSYPGEKGSAYKLGAEKFYDEAKTVSRFSGHPNIVRVSEFFYENNTAYFVMEYVRGSDLKAYVEAHGGALDEKTTLEFMLPVMDALVVVHGVGVLHRDISPDNIFVSDTGEVKLLDFGSARQVLGEQSKSLSVILKHGFAPIEQYQTRGKQGPWTDVYALGATMYFCLTGKIPEPAMDRIDVDGLIPPSRLSVRLSAQTEAALQKALSIKAADRFQTVAEMKQALPFPSLFAQGTVPPVGVFVPDGQKKAKEEKKAVAPPVPASNDASVEAGVPELPMEPVGAFVSVSPMEPVGAIVPDSPMEPVGTIVSDSPKEPYDPSRAVADAQKKSAVPAKKKRGFLLAAAAVCVLALLAFGAWRLFGAAFLPAGGGDSSSSAQGGGAQSGASSGTKATQTPAAPATATPVPTEGMSATPTPGWENTESPAATLTAAPTLKPTATQTAKPTPTQTAKPTPTPKPTLTPSVKPTTAATATPTSSAAATQSPAASSTPKPTSAPTPKPTPTPAVSYYMDVSPSSLSIAVGEVVEMPSVSTNCSYVYTTGTSSIVGISRTPSGAIGYVGKTPGSFTLTYTGYADEAHTTALCSATVSVTVYQP